VKGLAHEALGDLSEALVTYQSAAATAPPDDPQLNAAIYVEMGTVLQSGERFNAAIEANLRALGWLDRCLHADPALRSRVLHNLGREYYGLGEIALADEYFGRALAAATDAESVFRIANAHMSLGVSARAIGDLDRAVEHCNRALELLRRQGHERFANRVLNNLGDARYAAGRKSEARRLQQRCLERARELMDDLEIGIAAGTLARYCLESNQIAACIELTRESQAAAHRTGDRLHQALAIALEGQAFNRQGQVALADRKFRRALMMLSNRQAAGKLAEVCAMYADVLRERGNVDRAFAFMRMAADRDFGSLTRLIRIR
jgi:tetratricopeptide (TPR) repeat protein